MTDFLLAAGLLVSYGAAWIVVPLVATAALFKWVIPRG